MVQAFSRVLMLTAVLAAVGVAGGCGNDSKKQCDSIQAESRAVLDRSKGQTSVPAMAQVFKDSATKIRATGKDAGGDVQKAADKLAADLDEAAARTTDYQTPFVGVPYADDAKALDKVCE